MDNLHDYFYGKFPTDLRKLSFESANSAIRSIPGYEHLHFFGGRNWSQMESDLTTVSDPDKVNFIFSLFMMTVTDQCLYTSFSDVYPEWQKQTNFPKFGWAGFGPHNENPAIILDRPHTENTALAPKLEAEMSEFCKFMVAETNKCIAKLGIKDNKEYWRAFSAGFRPSNAESASFMLGKIITNIISETNRLGPN